MTVLFDGTIQHTGWFDGTFPGGGWQDTLNPLASGLQARSYWASSLNGAAIDQSVFFGGPGAPGDSGRWFNIHTNRVLTGLTIPSPFLVSPSNFLTTYLRTPSSSGAILWRLVVTDLPATPPPTVPP